MISGNNMDFKYHGRHRFLHFIDCYTDKKGIFLSGPMLVSGFTKAPKLFFSKDGYKPVSLIVDTLNNQHDSLVVFMEKNK